MAERMVEKVARAICAYQARSWGAADLEAHERWRGMARAAIEAMSEPNDAMQTAAIEKIGYEVDWVGGLMGSSYSAGVQVLADGYRASIDAALNEEVAG